MSNTLWTGSGGDKLYLQSGRFESTIKDSEDVSGIDASSYGIEWDGTDVVWCGGTDVKLYLQSGLFTATLKDSENISGIDTGPRGISEDGTNTPWIGIQADKLYLQSGKFTSTLKDSLDISGKDVAPQDISWDGTNTPWVGGASKKLYLYSGQFSSTIKDSENVNAVDTGPTGITLDVADTPWTGNGEDKLYLQSGQFTSTLKDSEDISLIDDGPQGISPDVLTARISAGTEYVRGIISTATFGHIVGLDTILERTIISTLVFDYIIDPDTIFNRAITDTIVFGDIIDVSNTYECSVTSTLTLDQITNLDFAILNLAIIDTLVLTDGAYPTYENSLVSSIVFDQAITTEMDLTTCVVKRHWPRWIFASATKHFDDNINLPFFIEGTYRTTDEEQKHVEFRLDGPDVVELSHNYFRIDLVINILWSFNQDDEDFHETERIKGEIIRAMNDFCIYRYGSGAFDDNSLLGILELTNGVRVNNFGQVRQDARLMQGTVEGTYRMFLNCN